MSSPASLSSARALPVVVGITGASGSILAFRLVRELLTMDIPVELILTEKSFQVVLEELGLKVGGGESHEKSARIVEYLGLPEDRRPLLSVFGNHQLDAPPSSGTHRTRGMVVIPCSMGTLGRIAAGIGDNLVARSADVTLKENRRLILVPRESPLNGIHLRNMLGLNQLGVIILPPMLTFYLPEYNNIDGQIAYTVGKTLDHLGIEHTLFTRWGDHRAQPSG
jgi:4-hydroxy-3-polyprenylbenzoate decarboxylase